MVPRSSADGVPMRRGERPLSRAKTLHHLIGCVAANHAEKMVTQSNAEIHLGRFPIARNLPGAFIAYREETFVLLVHVLR